jgi:serine/threonine protein kinase
VRNYQYAYGTTKPQTDQIPQNQEGTMTDISAKSFVSLNPRVGDMISEYKVIKKLGEGGMGTVYKCLDPLLKRHVALKLLKREFSQKESFRIRFEIEAQAVAQLRHPNIIQVFRAGEDPVRHNLFFAMDFIEGRPLDEVLRGNLAPEKALRYIQQVAEGLAYSHKKQILHRDIKPENIMISKDDCALIMDFGIAKVIGESPEEILEAHQSEEIGVSDLKLTQTWLFSWNAHVYCSRADSRGE